MPQEKEVLKEYAVELPGKGYVYSQGPMQVYLDQEPRRGVPYDSAKALLASARRAYRALGMSNVAEDLHIVSRVITISYTGWEFEPPHPEPLLVEQLEELRDHVENHS